MRASPWFWVLVFLLLLVGCSPFVLSVWHGAGVSVTQPAPVAATPARSSARRVLDWVVLEVGVRPAFAGSHKITCDWCPPGYYCWECMAAYGGCVFDPRWGPQGGNYDPAVCQPQMGGCIMSFRNVRTGNLVSIYNPPSPENQVCKIVPPLPGSQQWLKAQIVKRVFRGPPTPTPVAAAVCTPCN